MPVIFCPGSDPNDYSIHDTNAQQQLYHKLTWSLSDHSQSLLQARLQDRLQQTLSTDVTASVTSWRKETVKVREIRGEQNGKGGGKVHFSSITV